jgi:hypothetical protein
MPTLRLSHQLTFAIGGLLLLVGSLVAWNLVITHLVRGRELDRRTLELERISLELERRTRELQRHVRELERLKQLDLDLEQRKRKP